MRQFIRLGLLSSDQLSVEWSTDVCGVQFCACPLDEFTQTHSRGGVRKGTSDNVAKSVGHVSRARARAAMRDRGLCNATVFPPHNLR